MGPAQHTNICGWQIPPPPSSSSPPPSPQYGLSFTGTVALSTRSCAYIPVSGGWRISLRQTKGSSTGERLLQSKAAFTAVVSRSVLRLGLNIQRSRKLHSCQNYTDWYLYSSTVSPLLILQQEMSRGALEWNENYENYQKAADGGSLPLRWFRFLCESWRFMASYMYLMRFWKRIRVFLRHHAKP